MANQVDFILRNGLQVTTNVVVGSYTMVNAAPQNGMIVSGDVGIGTASPTSKLHVVGNIQISNTAVISGIRFADGSFQSTSAGNFYTPPGGVGGSIQYNDGGTFGGTTTLIYDSVTGNVGIGTTTASYPLHVVGAGPAFFNTTNGADAQIYVGNNIPSGSAGVFGYSHAGQYAYLTTADDQPTAHLAVTSGGNVGIGLTAPLSKLAVNGGLAIGTYAATMAAPENGLLVSGKVGIGTASQDGVLNLGYSSTDTAINVIGGPLGNLLVFESSAGVDRFRVDGAGVIRSGTWNGSVVTEQYGGTGQSGYSLGDILYASGATSLTKLPIRLEGNALISSGTVPTWGKIDLGTPGQTSHVTGTLPVSRGGTNVASFSAHAVVISNAVGTSLSSLTSAANAAVVFNSSGVPSAVSGSAPYQYLTTGAGGTDLSFASIDLANGVGSSILQVLNGGTGLSSLAQYSILVGSGLSTSMNTLATANTSALVTASTGAPQWTSGSTANTVLRTNGVTISFGKVSLGIGGTSDVSGILPLANGGTNASITASSGAMVYSTSTGMALTPTSQMFWDAANGRLGLGTDTPTGNLDVNGTAVLRDGLQVTGGTVVAAGTIRASSLHSNTTINAGGNVTVGALVSNSSITGGNIISNATVSSQFVRTNIAIVDGLNDSSSTSTGALIVAGGVGIGANLHVGGQTHLMGNVLISGNLAVTGNTTVIHTDELAVEDPLIQIGTGPNGTPLTLDDGFDRGLIMHYYISGPGDVHSFLGRDHDTGRLLFVNNVQPGAANIANPILANSPGFDWGTANFGNLILSAGANAVSTSTSTGALVLQGTGGAGIGGNLFVGGITNIGGTLTVTGGATAATFSAPGQITGGSLVSNSSTTTDTLQVNAGASIGGSLSVNGTLTANVLVSNSTVFSNLVTTGTITGNNVVGNISVSSGGTMNATGQITGGSLVSNGAISGSSTLNVPGQITGGSLVSNSTVTGNVLTANALISTVALNASGNMRITSANITTSGTTGALVVTGGIATGNNLFVTGSTWTGNIGVTEARASTSTTTGALTVAGGAGIVGNLHVGGTIFGVANTAINASNVTVSSVSTNGTLFLAFVDATSGNLSVRTNSSVNVNPSTGTVFATALEIDNLARFGSATILDTTAATSATSGALQVAGGAGVAGNLYVGGSIFGANLTATTIATQAAVTGTYYPILSLDPSGNVQAYIDTGITISAADNLLDIVGGLTVQNFGRFGNISVTNSTITTSGTTGALVVTGGIATGNNLFVAGSTWTGNISVNDARASTSATTGALTVAGGAGISGNAFVGGNVGINTTGTQGFRLYVNGTGKFTGTVDTDGQFLGNTGDSASVPGFSWGGDTDTGIYHPTDGTIGLVSNGTDVLTVSASNVSVRQSTAATSTTSGALRVTGGAGVVTGSFSANALTSTTSIRGNSFILNGTVSTTSTTSALTLDTFDAATFRTAHYIVQVTDNTATRYHSTQIMLIHDGTNVYQSEYNIIFSNSILGTFDSVISGGSVQLQFTASAATNKTIKVIRTALEV